jgi:hypothetical protein
MAVSDALAAASGGRIPSILILTTVALVLAPVDGKKQSCRCNVWQLQFRRLLPPQGHRL